MEEEVFLICPYCNEQISMLLDISIIGNQVYIEDCEVCCRPIKISYTSNGSEISNVFAGSDI